MEKRTRLLGIDPGTVRIGLAISDPQRRFASPLVQYVRKSSEQDRRWFRQLVDKEEIGAGIVGLAIHLDGREGPSAQRSREFADWLRKEVELECVLWDERFTTRQAESALWQAGLSHKRRKERRDQVAAALLLQSYLDAGCPPIPPNFAGLDETSED